MTEIKIEWKKIKWKTDEARRNAEENMKKYPNLKLHCLICPKVHNCPYDHDTIVCDENKRNKR